MQYCRGPLPDGHPTPGVTYFCIDHDIAAAACNLRVTPPVEALRHVKGPCVLLDAHRAPDEWYGIALLIPQLLVQGDPQAMRPRGCNSFAAELSKQPCPDSVSVRLELRCVPKLTDALLLARGKQVVLAGTHQDAETVYQHLRPTGLLAGDVVHDMFGKAALVHQDHHHSSHIFVDNGRRALTRKIVSQHVVVSPSQVRAGEYDTVIVLPGVAPALAKAVCHRCRYMIVAVAHSSMGYAPTLSR